MADGSADSAAAAGATVAGFAGFLGRERLARMVVLGSFLTVFLLVAAVMYANSGAMHEVAVQAFNAILPVLASWMGTVLAFYFSAQNAERTSNSLDKVIGQAGGSADRQVKIAEKMIPLQQIRALQDMADGLEKISLRALKDKFAPAAEGKSPVSRLVFIERGVFRYVLHQSTLDAFLLNSPADAGSQTLADLVADPASLRQISKLVVFVNPGATLSDARATLEAVPGAYDIIVTTNGNASAPMLGWLTNVDLIKALSAP